MTHWGKLVIRVIKVDQIHQGELVEREERKMERRRKKGRNGGEEREKE